MDNLIISIRVLGQNCTAAREPLGADEGGARYMF